MSYYNLPDDKTFLITAKGLVFNEQGQLLLLRIGDLYSHPRWNWKWDVPGGLVKIDEDIEQALAREIREECGIEVEIGRLLATNDTLLEGFKFSNGKIRDARIIGLGFLCKYRAGDIKLSDEHSEFQWVESDKIDSLELYPPIKTLIEKGLKSLR